MGQNCDYRTELTQAEITNDIVSVPFRHYAIRFPQDVGVDGIVVRHNKLLGEVKQDHKKFGTAGGYNVLMVSEWLCLIPRTHSKRDKTAAGAAGMIGLVWLKDQDERDSWERLGYTEHLKYLGIPRGVQD